MTSQTCCVPITWGMQPVINSLKSVKNTQVWLLFSEPKIITSLVDIFTSESFIVLTPWQKNNETNEFLMELHCSPSFRVAYSRTCTGPLVDNNNFRGIMFHVVTCPRLSLLSQLNSANMLYKKVQSKLCIRVMRLTTPCALM